MQVRVDEDTAAWWRALAEREGISVGELVRRAVATVYAALDAMPSLDEPATRAVAPVEPVTARRPRSEIRQAAAVAMRCSKAARHRPGVRCGYCGETP